MRQKFFFDRLGNGAKYVGFTSIIKSRLSVGQYDVGHFPLVFDPSKEKRALIMGMFVLRPAITAWTSSICPGDRSSDGFQLHEIEQWAYNYMGIDGGWLIADRSPFDAFRVALHYGICDAVIIGTNTVSKEGMSTPSTEGYLWQPYFISESENLKACLPDALQLIEEQRKDMQKQGIISERVYPAQIVFSLSGDFQGERDFLDARIFSAVHPNGEHFECYILTGDEGSRKIRERVLTSFPHLIDRIDDMLIRIPPCPSGDSDIDISLIPNVLFEQLGVRVANHDGGRDILRRFCAAGAIAQVNLTLCRKKSLQDILPKYLTSSIVGSDVDVGDISTHPIAPLECSRVELFFTSAQAQLKCDTEGTDNPLGAIPQSWREVYCVADGDEDTAVVTFDTRYVGDFVSD